MSLDPNAVRLDEEAEEPTPISEVPRAAVTAAVETIALLGAHRWSRPLRTRPRIEARLLALRAAVFSVGGDAMTYARTAWEATRELGDPWALFAAAFLASAADPSLGAVRALVDDVATEDEPEIAALASAFALTSAGPRERLVNVLAMSDNPSARALGLATSSNLETADPRRIERALEDAAPCVLASALRAASQHVPALPRRAIDLIEHEDPRVAFEASRCALLFGSPVPLDALRASSWYRSLLGARAVDLLVLAGDIRDLALLTELPRARPTPAFLRTLGQFGHPEIWSYLAHYLVDVELAEAAEDALLETFGEIVAPKHRASASAYRTALAARELNPSKRLCRGELWSEGRVIAACASGELSAEAVALRADELRARTQRRVFLNTNAWGLTAANLGQQLGARR